MFFLGKWLANFVVLAVVSLIYKGLTYANLTAMILELWYSHWLNLP